MALRDRAAGRFGHGPRSGLGTVVLTDMLPLRLTRRITP